MIYYIGIIISLLVWHAIDHYQQKREIDKQRRISEMRESLYEHYRTLYEHFHKEAMKYDRPRCADPSCQRYIRKANNLVIDGKHYCRKCYDERRGE